MSFIKKLVGKIQNYKNEEVVYAEDYNKDFNLLREVINNNAEGIAETQTSVSELKTDVQNLVEGTVTINSINGSAIIDNTLPYNALSTDTLNKLPNKNELTDLNDNVVKSYFYNTTLPSADLHNAILKYFNDDTLATSADPITIPFQFTQQSFLDVDSEFMRYTGRTAPEDNLYPTWLTVDYCSYDTAQNGEHTFSSKWTNYTEKTTQVRVNVSSNQNHSESNGTTINQNTRLKAVPALNINTHLGESVKQIVFNNKNATDSMYIKSGYTNGYYTKAINLPYTFQVTYTDGTVSELIVEAGATVTLNIPTTNGQPKKISSIQAITEEYTGGFGRYAIQPTGSYPREYGTDFTLKFSEVSMTITYTSDKANLWTSLLQPIQRSNKMYFHIIADTKPKSVSTVGEETTALELGYTIENVISGTGTTWNEYTYMVNTENITDAVSLCIERTNASDKIYGYYIVG